MRAGLLTLFICLSTVQALALGTTGREQEQSPQSTDLVGAWRCEQVSNSALLVTERLFGHDGSSQLVVRFHDLLGTPGDGMIYHASGTWSLDDHVLVEESEAIEMKALTIGGKDMLGSQSEQSLLQRLSVTPRDLRIVELGTDKLVISPLGSTQPTDCDRIAKP
jgi:hypothetical protein